MLHRTVVAVLIGVVVFGLSLTACGDDDTDTETETGDTEGVVTTTSGEVGVEDDAFRLTSSAFREGEAIPDEHALRDDNVSPPLTWRFPPDGRVEFVLVVDDPDAPRGEPFVHWLVAGIPVQELTIAEGDVPEDAVEGTNDLGTVGWSGPAPPGGEVHDYRFTVHALGEPSGLDEGFTKSEFDRAIEGKILASATLTGHYPGS